MKPPFVRSAFNYDMMEASNESAIKVFDKSKTRQEFAEEADINTIVKRFHLTGELPTNIRMPTYQDYEGIFDFQTAMNAIVKSEEAFEAMPAEVRARFHNNTAEFLDFCSNPANREEAERLGLVDPKKIPDPDPQLVALEAIRDRLPEPETPPSPPTKGGKTDSKKAVS